MRKRPNDVEKLDQISQVINPDNKGNLTVGKNLGVDGKLTLKSLVSESNPDGDITKELDGDSTRHGYTIFVNDNMRYEVYTTRNYDLQVGVYTSVADFGTNSIYDELRVVGYYYPASGVGKSGEVVFFPVKVHIESGQFHFDGYNFKASIFSQYISTIATAKINIIKLY